MLRLMAAYCTAKVGSFADSRRSLEITQPLVSDADTVLRFEAFRTAILAQATNGDGDADHAISLIRQHPLFGRSDILKAELFEIYVEDERWNELLAWWNDTAPGPFDDQSLRAICEAEIDLIRGSAAAAQHVLEAVPIKASQDGAKSLEVARYRVAHRNGAESSTAAQSSNGRMSDTMIATPNSITTQTMSQLSLPFISARGVNFNIDKDKLNRPGDALPVGFFY